MSKYQKTGIAAAFLAVVGLVSGCDRAVKVSSFGYDPEDSTRFIQAALDSGKKKLILDRQSGPWYTLPLKMRSNTELVLEPGVELVAKRGEFKHIRDYLLELPYATNVVIRGGKGSTLRMWKNDYQGPDYTHGEWRYALRIFHCGNVLVEGLTIAESGGDGIGVSGRDITIRNCVMDRNHRQGISVFTAENLLIENCVLANTSGTAPAAGIDFEPDRSGESLINCVMRNCVITNNHGHGIEVFLNNLKSSSNPISISIENCRIEGNAAGTHVSACGSNKTKDFVTGTITYSNCTFSGSSRPAILIEGLPDRAFDAVFKDCTISNACPSGAEVVIGAANMAQGVPDGITLDNLRIYQREKRDWFIYAPQGVGRSPARISGEVTVFAPGAKPENFKIDAKWRSERMPAVNRGRPLPPRAALPAFADVEAVDKCPGEYARLAPITLIGGVKLVFLAERAGKVGFSGRQVIRVPGRKPDVTPITVTALDAKGRPGRKWTIPRPADKSTEFQFDAPRPGFYLLEAPAGGTRFALEKSTVPVAINVSSAKQIVAPVRADPFSLWVDAPAKGFLAVLSGDSYYRFAAEAVNPLGRIVASDSHVNSSFFVPCEGAAGLWRFDFRKAGDRVYDWIYVDVLGVPGCVFLSAEKRWRVK